MIGIERLHKLIADIDVRADPELWYVLRGGTEGDWDCEEHDDKTLGGTLADIADQIERGQSGRVSRMRALSAVTEMERRVSGAEGAEDSPVARWARELREALGGDGRDPAADVSVSACDLLPQEDREAIAWVREHGGIGCVQTMAAKLKDMLGWTRERAGVSKYEIVDHGELIDALDRRLMPDGIEWPRYESGESVGFGDEVSRLGEVFEVYGICLYRDGGYTLNTRAYSKGERVKRPAVLAADGEPLEVGQTVWDTDAEADAPLTVVEVSSDLVRCGHARKDGKTHRPCYPPDQLTHQRPVLDADGNRIEPAMDVWWVCEGDERGVHAERLHVESIGEDGLVTCDPLNGGTWVELEPSELYVNRPVPDADGVPINVGDAVWMAGDPDGPYRVTEVATKYATHVHGYSDELGDLDMSPSQLTHERPDTWQRIEEDIAEGFMATEETTRDLRWKARDIVRRCRALAERESGE